MLQTLALVALLAASAAPPDPFAALEAEHGGRLGVTAVDTATGKTVGHRGGERFPFCSTFKFMLAGAVLKQDDLGRRIAYKKSELVVHSPVTSKHASMTVAALCVATLQTSDNTAANLLTRAVGGPAAVTAYARSIGDAAFRLDRWEPGLNDATPGDPRDTTTPDAMAKSLQALLLGDALKPAARARLVTWMKGNKTGDERIRAGVPAGWRVADKTGTGVFGTTNDIGVAWPGGGRAPIVVAVYYARKERNAAANSRIVAEATRLAVSLLTGRSSAIR